MKLKLYTYLKEKKYDLIYDEFGKDVYNLFTPKKILKEEKKNLMDNKEYQKVLDKFYNPFSKCKIKRLIKKDKKYLFDNGMYFDLCEKYPSLENKYYEKMFKKDFENITGEKYKNINIKKYGLKNQMFKLYKQDVIYNISSGIVLFLLLFNSVPFIVYSSNTGIYIHNYKLVKEYDEKLALDMSKYKDISNDNELFVYLMDDIRSNTYYNNGSDNIPCGNNFRIVLNDDNYYGACRHMADKLSTEINCINSDYEAFDLLVYMDSEAAREVSFKMNNTKGLECYDENRAVSTGSESIFNKITTHMIGNHLVTVVWSDEYNCYLVLDPTNPSIGVLEDGKIRMLNADTTELNKYMPYGQYTYFPGLDFFKTNKAFIESYTYDIDYDYLNENLGLDSQNKILEKKKTMN